MKKLLAYTALGLLITFSLNGQNLFLIGENSYPCTEEITLQPNSYEASNLDISLAKNGEKGLFAISTESDFGAIFNEKLIIYLEDGTVIICNEKKASEYVDERAKALYSLTDDQLVKLKSSNIHTVRYTLETGSDRGLLSDMEWNWSASNKGAPTKTIFTDFFDHGISRPDYDQNLDEKRMRREAEESERIRLDEEQKRRTEILNRTQAALERANTRVYGEGSATGTEGISYDLAGRQAMSLPKPTYDIRSEGIVVVEITVDRNGKVTKAVPGVKGSTTLEEYFLRVAREAAMSAKFDRKPDAPVIQKGTITYHFILR